MKKNSQTFLIALCFFLFSSLSCSPPKPVEIITPTQAEQNLMDLCLTDYGYRITTRLLKNTLWVYLPIEHAIFDFKSSEPMILALNGPKRTFSIEYIDGTFENDQFSFEYDIIPTTREPKSYGYQTTYAEAYSTKQNNLLSCIKESFFDAKGEANQKLPVFVVIVIADIVKGIETRTTLNLLDFKKYMSGALPYDEYVKRYVSDTHGHPDIIKDWKGKHLKFTDISWSEFLSKQIVSRVQFKYMRSDFQPTHNHEKEILRMVAAATDAYSFEDFNKIKLSDLRSETESFFDKDQLVTFKEEIEKIVIDPTNFKANIIYINQEGNPEKVKTIEMNSTTQPPAPKKETQDANAQQGPY